jgi:hypothetical protein
MNLFINDNLKPGAKLNSNPSKSDKNLLSLDEWLKTEPSTRAVELVRHILTTDTRMTIITKLYTVISLLLNSSI